MEIKSNIEIATLHFVLILKKLGHISALRYVTNVSLLIQLCCTGTKYMQTNEPTRVM